jgi:hypothetical protein
VAIFCLGIGILQVQNAEGIMRSLEIFSGSEREGATRPLCEIGENTGPTSRRQPPLLAYPHEVREVRLNRLRPTDYVIIHTQNSVYRFTVIEPRERYGLLTGGSLGHHRIKMTLVRTIPASSPDETGKLRALKEHSRAVFRLPGGDESVLMITSPITRLVQVTDGPSMTSLPAG